MDIVQLLNDELKPVESDDREDHVRSLVKKLPKVVTANQDYFSGDPIHDVEYRQPISLQEAASGVFREGDKKLPKKTQKVDQVATDSDVPFNGRVKVLLPKSKGRGKATRKSKPKVC